MSLIVAEVHNDGISIVADTKVTFAEDEAQTRHDLENVLPKIVILRNDLCVGVAGNDPVGVIGGLIDIRAKSTADILSFLVGLQYASFVVCELQEGKPRLLQVSRGSIDDRTSLGRAWVGDQRGYEIFQQRYQEWPDGTDCSFRLLSSIQWLVTFRPVPSIGGYHTRIATTAEGFRFVAEASVIGPEELAGISRILPDRIRLDLATPIGGDTSWISLVCAAGVGASFGASAFLVIPPGLGVLFTHTAPMIPIPLRASDMATLAREAFEQYGQQLIYPQVSLPIGGFSIQTVRPGQ